MTSLGEAYTVGNMSAERGKVANRKRGCHIERAWRSLLGQALKGQSPRERTWLKGHQGARRGRKAPRHMVSVRAQRDPGRQSPGVVDLDEWVALWGWGTSGERAHAVCAQPVGHTLKWGEAWGRSPSLTRRVPPSEDREVGRNHEAGARNQWNC